MKIIETKDVPMKDIQDPSTANQFRVNGTDVHHVEELELSLDLKGLKNPISIKKDGTTNNYLIVDGCHRYLAAERLGWTKIKANIFQPGTREQEDRFRFLENDKHDPVKRNTKADLNKYLTRMILDHKKFGPSPNLSDLDEIVKWGKKELRSWNVNTIRATAKKVLEDCPCPNRAGTQSYIKGTKQLINAIRGACGGIWEGESVRTFSKGYSIQVISQQSDSTLKPGLALVQKHKTEGKVIGVIYIGRVENTSDAKIDEQRNDWIEKISDFQSYMKKKTRGNLVPFDKIIVLPQKDCEMRAGLRGLEYKNGKLWKIDSKGNIIA